jgi:hypothetical protein
VLIIAVARAAARDSTALWHPMSLNPGSFFDDQEQHLVP